MGDRVIIEDLEVRSRIGVTAAERRKPQRLSITLEMTKALAAAGRADDLRTTVDYYAVAARVRKVAGKGKRKLIERLAEDIARIVLREFDAQGVTVTVKKFVLPDARFVAVRVERSKD